LLYASALLEYVPTALVPESEEEMHTWRGHLLGLRSALHCLAMHEQHLEPEVAGFMVDQHIVQAIAVFKGFGDYEPDEGTGG
jgi:hypothetical protein